MDSGLIDQFTELTAADREKATQYLMLTEGNIEQAVQLYFDSDGMDLGAQGGVNPASATGNAAGNAVEVPSDDDDMEMVGAQQLQQPSFEDDEAMARRLQEESYGAGAPGTDIDAEGVRAPIGRTTETLVGGSDDWRSDPHAMREAIAEQMMAREQRQRAGRPGIFNQGPSVWDNTGSSVNPRVAPESSSGASLPTSKANMLAEMYRPPFEIMSRISWDAARDEGKENLKWILVNVQDQSIFDCQVLNRDIWKNTDVQATIKENFVFMQYAKDDVRGEKYMQYYFHNRDVQDAYPHIAIVDPRTGEQVKVWSGPPVPKPLEFLGQLHEFLDRYSLQVNARNPVATKKPEKKTKDVAAMTEEEMLEMALQNSLAGGSNGAAGPRDADPDALTKADHKGKAAVRDPLVEAANATNGITPSEHPSSEVSPFDLISSTSPHVEPPPDTTTATRIQFRSSGSRVIRRFGLNEPVVRLFEWLKAEPWEGKEGKPFELSFMGRNLMEDAREGRDVGTAGLKNGTVMVEFDEGE